MSIQPVPSSAVAPVAPKAVRKVPTAAEKFGAIEKFVGSRLAAFEVALKGNTLGLTAEKFVKAILYATSRTPLLVECTPKSLFLAALQAADIGLPIGTGLSHLIPYKNKEKTEANRGEPVYEAQFQPDYKGLAALLLESGEVVRIDAQAVHEKDELELVFGTVGEKLVHRPCWKAARGAAVAYYVIATLRDGSQKVGFMTRDEVETVRKNYASDTPAWAKSFDEMAKKTVFKRMTKFMRRVTNERAARAMAHDARADGGEAPDYADVLDVAGEVVDPPAEAPKQFENAGVEAVPKRTADRAREEVAAKAAELVAKAPPAQAAAAPVELAPAGA